MADSTCDMTVAAMKKKEENKKREETEGKEAKGQGAAWMTLCLKRTRVINIRNQWEKNAVNVTALHTTIYLPFFTFVSSGVIS